MATHSSQQPADGIHTVIAFEYADAAARLAAVRSSSDVGRVARDADTGLFFVLSAAPSTWRQLGATLSELGGASQSLAINAQTGTAYTLVPSDAGKLVTCNNAAAVTVTVPTNATAAFPLGTVITLAQLGAGAVALSAAGVTLRNPSLTNKTRVQYAQMSITKIATDEWLVSGDLAVV